MSLGFTDHGTPLPAASFSNPWVAALVRDPGFGNGEVREVGQAAGVTFYAAKNAAGNYCVGIGVASTPSIDALSCGPAIGGLSSGARPIEDFSSISNSNGNTYATRLAGFADEQVVRVAVVGSDGGELFSTPVVNGLYAAADVPQETANTIVAYDSQGNVLYRRDLIAPQTPRPVVPTR